MFLGFLHLKHLHLHDLLHFIKIFLLGSRGKREEKEEKERN